MFVPGKTSPPTLPSSRGTSPPVSILLDKGCSDTFRSVIGTSFRPDDEHSCVTFNPKKTVVLIATRQERQDLVSKGEIAYAAYKASDYASFKEDAVKEIKKYMISQNITDIKQALKELYQPNQET